VWIAGGLPKGADFTALFADHRDRIKALVLIGADDSAFREAIAATAPDLEVVRIEPALAVDSGVPKRRGEAVAPPPPSRPLRAWPATATPCCWPLPRRAWTSSSTTTRAANCSPKPSRPAWDAEMGRQTTAKADERRRRKLTQTTRSAPAPAATKSAAAQDRGCNEDRGEEAGGEAADGEVRGEEVHDAATVGTKSTAKSRGEDETGADRLGDQEGVDDPAHGLSPASPPTR
jgi:pimeloyl-ACP methyl ester carboxylesterase